MLGVYFPLLAVEYRTFSYALMASKDINSRQTYTQFTHTIREKIEYNNFNLKSVEIEK